MVNLGDELLSKDRFPLLELVPMSSIILDNSINHKTMRSAVLEYRQTQDLEAHERAALASILDHVRDKRITASSSPRRT